MALGEVFKDGDKVVYTGGGKIAHSCTVGRQYTVKIHIPHGYPYVVGDVLQIVVTTNDAFDLVKTTSPYLAAIGDIVGLSSSIGAYVAGLTHFKPYEVKSVLTGNQSGNIVTEYLIVDDTGQTNWFNSDLFEIILIVPPTVSNAKASLGGQPIKVSSCKANTHLVERDPGESASKGSIVCTCAMRDLMMNGCRCGALESERKSKI